MREGYSIYIKFFLLFYRIINYHFHTRERRVGAEFSVHIYQGQNNHIQKWETSENHNQYIQKCSNHETLPAGTRKLHLLSEMKAFVWLVPGSLTNMAHASHHKFIAREGGVGGVSEIVNYYFHNYFE